MWSSPDIFKIWSDNVWWPTVSSGTVGVCSRELGSLSRNYKMFLEAYVTNLFPFNYGPDSCICPVLRQPGVWIKLNASQWGQIASNVWVLFLLLQCKKNTSQRKVEYLSNPPPYKSLLLSLFFFIFSFLQFLDYVHHQFQGKPIDKLKQSCWHLWIRD